MKFIDINSVRGLEIDQPVFIKDAEGKFGYGRLIEESKTGKGIRRVFEVACFYNEAIMWKENADAMNKNENLPNKLLKQVLLDNITHVCIPK